MGCFYDFYLEVLYAFTLKMQFEGSNALNKKMTNYPPWVGANLCSTRKTVHAEQRCVKRNHNKTFEQL